MWNIFDTAFVLITALYIILRWKGLSTGNSELLPVPTLPLIVRLIRCAVIYHRVYV
jgi:hypothetical protein